MKVAIVAEFYPRARDPVLGIWAHRQAMAARDAGAEVEVLVLHRVVPPRQAWARHDPRELTAPLRQRSRGRLDGIRVTYLPFASPPFSPAAYASWGAWAAPPLAVGLRALRRRFSFDLVHAHYAVPAADAVRRARVDAPMVVSVHGGDVLFTARHGAAGRRAVRRAFDAARLVLANSAGTRRRCEELGARDARVVHLGTDLPARPAPDPFDALVSVGHLVARKRHGDVVRALWLLRNRHPGLRLVVVGDGPERTALEALVADLGLTARVELRGALPHAQAVGVARRGRLFVLPSVDEAFGVAYVEAMAGWVPAIGTQGEDGPEEIAAAGDGLRLVAPADVESLATEIDAILSDRHHHRDLGRAARATVERSFTWERCGRATVTAYEDALR